MDFKVVNLGVYYEHLKTKIEELMIKESKEKDPYEKYNLREQIRLVGELLKSYQDLIMNQ